MRRKTTNGRRLGLGALVLLLAVLVAACGSGSAPVSSGATVPDTLAEGETHAVGIEEVLGDDGPEVTVRTKPMPLEGATGECASTVETALTESGNEIQLEFRVDSDAPRFFEGCETEPRTMTVELAEPVRERHISSAGGGIFWIDADRGWIGCASVVMTCVSDPASCDGFTLRDTISNNDVPQGFGMDSRCEEPWAVVDIDVGAAACPATGDASNPCAGESFRRMYLEIQDEAWVVVNYDEGPGCGKVPEQDPDFPRHLCDDLPAL